MNADGSNQHRISFGPGRNGTPVWSPRGDMIAFTKVTNAAISIAVMRPDGSGERVITAGWEDEGPTWAPNGRVLMFTAFVAGRSRRANMVGGRDGQNQRRVLTPGSASDPAWSPLIQ